MAGETTVGSIVGFLRLNITDFEAGIAKAQALANRLDGQDVDVKVDVNAAGAVAKLGAVDAAMRKTDGSTRELDHSMNNMGRQSRFLVGMLLTLGPALVPLAAATTGLAAGFGTMGASGVLAIVGIRNEMRAGTLAGAQYRVGLTTLKNDMNLLGKTAAKGTLAPFQAEVSNLQKTMPALNTIVGQFSVVTGKTAGSLTTGLVAALVALEPLSRDAGVYILNLTQRFTALMSGSGVVAFGDYVRSVFPQVMQSFEQVVGAVIKLVASFAPFGSGILTLLGDFSNVILSIPIDVLNNISTAGLSVFLAFKAYGLLVMPIHEVGVALRWLGTSAEFAATAMTVLKVAAGGIAVVLAVATFAWSKHSESVRENQQAVNEITDALIASNGAITESIRLSEFKRLSDQGGVQLAKDLGLNLALVTDAYMGNVPASKQLNGQLVAMSKGLSMTGSDSLVTADKIQKLMGILGVGTSQFTAASQAQKDWAAAVDAGTTGTDRHAVALQALATKAGTTVPALIAAMDAQTKNGDAASTAAAKMFVEGDAAGLLKVQLDALNGKAISAAQAQNSFDSSLSNMGTHVNKTGSLIKFTTTSIHDMSAASVALRGQLIGQITNLEGVAEANRGAHMSGETVRAGMVTMRKQIIDNAVAHGVSRAAVTAFVDSILKIPKTIPPIPIEVRHDAALAKIAVFQKRIDAIKQGKVPGIDANSAAGRAVIAAIQKGIDNIKQGKPPGVTVNITPAQARRRAIQAEIDAIKQGKVPGMTVNTAAGKERLTDLQNQAAGLHGKTITIGVKANFSMGTGGGGSVIPGIFTSGHAAGGAINGPGSGTSDSIPAWLSNGEYVINAAQTAKYGALLEAINSGTAGYAKGGQVGLLPPPLPTRMDQAAKGYLGTIGFKPDMAAFAGTAGGAGALGGGSLGGSGYQRQMQILRAAFPGLSMNSGYRPGAITSSGNASFHSMGRAVDLPPRWDVFNWLRANYGASSKEIIFTPAGGRQIKNGRPLTYSGQVAADHYNHIHWAYAKGGPVGRGRGMATGGPIGAINAAYGRGRPASASSATIQASIDAITKLTAAWKTAIEAADAATRRAELVKAIAAAITELHKAQKAKDKSGVSSASSSYTDAKKALVEFEAAAKVSREDAKIAAQQEALATKLKVVANKEAWAFDHMSAVRQLADVDRRLKAEKRYSDEWMTLAKQRESLADQIAADAKAAMEAEAARLKQIADDAQTALENAASKLNAMLDARAGILDQLSAAQATYSSSVTSANAALAQQTQQLEAARTAALSTWAKLDEKITAGFAPGMGFLIGNAKAQIGQFTAWMEQLDLARSRGVSEAVVTALGLDQGPQALAQLKQLNKGTVDQVAELNSLVAAKTTAAHQQMIREKTQMLGELGRGLLEAQQVAATAIADAQATFLESQATLTAQMALVGTDQGRTFAESVAQGLMAGIPAIVAAAQQVQAAMASQQATAQAAAAPLASGQSAADAQAAHLAHLAHLWHLQTLANLAKTGHAGGGWITGPGSGTSDSILRRVSAGEFVVNAASARQNSSLLSAINSGQRIVPAISSLRGGSGDITVAAPIVHVYVDGKEFRGLVRVEIDQDAYAKDMTTRRKVKA